MRNDTHVIYVHRGSSFPSSLKELQTILNDVENSSLSTSQSLAMISKRAVEKLRKRGFDTESLDEVLFKCGSERIVIAPLYLFKGIEFDTLTNEHLKYYIRENLIVSEPLIAHEHDVALLSSALSKCFDDTNVLFIGHGSTSEANDYYDLIEQSLRSSYKDNKVFVRTLNDDPKEFSKLLKEESIEQITIYPLMFTAGYHVTKDIFGDDSWRSILEESGTIVVSKKQGLLANKSVRDLIHNKIRKLLEV